MQEDFLKEILDKLSSDSILDSDRVFLFIELSNYYIDKDFSESMKYASLSTIATDVPRADACCCIGDKYFLCGNMRWARIWYNNAVGNISNDINTMYYSWLPLQKIAQTFFIEEDFGNALKYIEASLLHNPSNEENISLKDIILEKLNEKMQNN